MGAKQSFEMTEALKLLKQDASKTVYAVVKELDTRGLKITQSAISRNAEWQAVKKQREEQTSKDT